MNKYKLTIAILTMNRAEQMRHAVKTCFQSLLPERTQFVIVDNASTDHTQKVAEELKKQCEYDLIYKCLPENKGVGGGRNVCFDLAEGEYVYFLDDDAEIPLECNKTFFSKSLSYMDRNPDVMSLTTKIEDEVFGKRVPHYAKTLKKDGLPCVYLFQGGSTFLRRSFFESPLFMEIMYGNEEIPVSMYVLDSGYYNVYMEEIFINHLPKVDKWKINGDRLKSLGVNNTYAIKTLMYPSIFRFPLFVVYKMRMRRYQIKNRELLQEEKKAQKQFVAKNKLRKIRCSTVMKAFFEFGATVF